MENSFDFHILFFLILITILSCTFIVPI